MKEYTVKVYEDRTEWYFEGKLHREDKPAVEWNHGYKCWYKNGLLHRLDGPAREWKTGTQFWYQNGQLHREDGPAIYLNSGHKEWWINGKRYPEQEFLTLTKGKNVIKDLEELAKKHGYKLTKM
jgi:hypothetical protein